MLVLLCRPSLACLQFCSAFAGGMYTITAAGATGANTTFKDRCRGGLLSRTVYLTQGAQLAIAVGQMGYWSTGNCGSGGGGTFVVYANTSQPILVAGGGGSYCGFSGTYLYGTETMSEVTGKCDASVTSNSGVIQCMHAPHLRQKRVWFINQCKIVLLHHVARTLLLSQATRTKG
jgi:hypothetical protein